MGFEVSDFSGELGWGSPPFIKAMKFGDLEVEQPYLGDLRSPWLLTTYKSWDDPPSVSVGFLV